MQQKSGFLSTFTIVILLCLLILGLSLSGKLSFLTSFLEKGTSAVQGTAYKTFQKLPFASEDEQIKKLKEENLNLLSRVNDYERLKKENQALLDQFQTAYPKSTKLLEADIIGVPDFIPGISTPDIFILNKGLEDGVKKGYAVVAKNNLVGVISEAHANLSKVETVNKPSLLFTAKTQNGVDGMIKGGDILILDNILLSENIKTGELVLTKGSVNSNGIGILPDLIVGKISSVEKNPSDLFQKAKVESFLDFTKLSSVFIYIQSE